jgi:hypothetical protein
VSYDISIDAEPCEECGHVISVEVSNATYNYAPAVHEAVGFSYSALNGVMAIVALPALEKCEAEFKAHPDRYERLIRGEGTWGTMPTLAEFHHRLVEACRAMPHGKIHVG